MNRQKKKRQPIVAFAAAILLALFTPNLHAQNNNVYMHSGTQTVPAQNSLNFYDSGGASSPSFWWEKWYNHNENATLTFKNGTLPIQVTFNQFTAYDGNTGANIGQYALRINDDHLYVYEGDAANDANLITVLTGTIKESFTFMSNGPITFKFVSNGSFREEGWAASVSTATAYKVQKPIVVKDECSDEVVLYNTAFGASLYYTTNGSDPVVDDPLTGATLYDESFIIDLDAGNASVTVKAIAVVGEDESGVATHLFQHSDQRPAPTDPTITINGNMVTITPGAVPVGLNETYNVRYTVDGTEPSANNGTLLTSPWAPFEWHTPNTTFKAVTVAVTCSDKVSNVVSKDFGNVTVPTPVITFNDNGSASISCSLTGATIYYTLDGSEPTTSSTQHGITSVTTEVLAIGTTVKAIAYYGSEGYVVSDMASSVYVPEGGSTVGGGIVLLDDREPHSWSYYSDGDQPIHSLKPADVKITYFGNGTNNMTTAAQNGDNPTAFGANATGVQVNVGEPENQFIYLKTLENDDPEGEGNEYSYTTISNPFQVRPVGESSTGTVTVNETVPVVSTGTGTSNYSPMYTYYADYGFKSEYIIPTSYFTNAGISSGEKLTSITLFQATAANWTATSLTIKLLNSNTSNYGNSTFLADNGTTVYTNSSYSSGSNSSHTFNFDTPFVYTGGNLVVQISSGHNGSDATSSWYGISSTNGNYQSFYGYYRNNNATTYTNGSRQRFLPNTTFTVERETPSTIPGYRGFYAWRVKSLSGGLGIQRVNGTNVGVNEIINAEEDIKFVTSNAEGNEVEFEALWAQAYVTTCSSNNGLSAAIASSSLNANVSYERNFVVVTNGAQNDIINNTSQKPVTITQLYPDGSGTMNSSRFIAGNFIANNDTKFENIFLRNGGASAYSYIYYDAIYYNNRWYYINWNTNQITANTSGATQSSFVDASLYDEGSYIDFGDGAVTVGSNSYTLYRYIYSRSSGATSTSTDYYAQGNDLVFGRGISAITSGELCARYVFGYRGTANETKNLSFHNRFESGSFGHIYSLYADDVYTITGTATLYTTFGSDYDRANNADNLKLTVNGYHQSYGLNFTSSNSRYDIVNKTGTFTGTFYCGFGYITTSSGHIYGNKNRNVEVLGGDYSADEFVGGIDGYFNVLSDPNYDAIKIRIKGGTFGVLYPSGIHLEGYGNRHLIATGGTFTNWITGACNGTDADGGITFGSSYLYFGGNAIQVSNEGIYGSGYGSQEVYGTTDEDSYYVTASTVVIADEAQVTGSVYGGGNNGYALNGSDVYILGGTVAGNVYGGANKSKGAAINVTMRDGTVEGNIYGGSNTRGTISGLATINLSGGTVTNVYGGGLGASTSMVAGTKVNISGDATINNNVYGGGELGTVTGNTNVTVSGGTMKDVYGAGKGGTTTAAITGQTTVTVTGGTVTNVYGGGENGDVTNGTNQASTVTIDGATISGDVFGGGQMGKTTGAVTVNMFNGNVRGNVFGGAYGEQGSVYVTGLRTVNMTGGHVYGNLYGGSRYANDGNNLNIAASSFGSSTETATISVTNISGGTIDQNVYSAGYYGNTFGSVYTFIGKNAIENAPHKQPTSGVTYGVKTLIISETVWAGGDWGTFSGSFGGATVSGNSNIYVDGTDYETTTTQTSNAQYMNISGSVLGCGTSCDAGKAERTIMIRNYGTANASGSKDEPYSDATRTLFSIQRAKLLVIDNAHLNFSGQGMVNSLGTTEKYSIYEIANTGAATFNTEDMNYGVRLVNGSSIFLNAPVSQITNFISASCDNIYTANLSSGYTPLEPNDLSNTDNKVRVNGGTFVEVKYGIKFGMLKGYAHMMVSTAETDATCAYARPRWESNAAFNINDSNYDNRDDGGWVSYTASNNTFDLAGNSGTVQMPYENHTHATKNGEDYFRIWRDGGVEHYREGVFNAHATGTDAFKTVDVTITLPPLRDRGYVYRFETVGTGENTSISYGADIMTFDAARATGSGNDWISYTNNAQTSNQSQSDVQSLLNEGILANPDVNYGLVIMPTANAGLAGGSYLISQNSDENLALSSTQFTNNDFTKDDQVTFRLTYYDKLSANMTWDPMTIVLVQVDPDDPSVILDRVTISLAVNTSTTITQEFNTTLYAVMQGKGSTSDTYTAKVMLPTFTAVSGQEATFTVNSVSFEAHNNGVLVNHGSTYTKTQFAVSYGASVNYDNTDGWANKTGQDHDANQTSGDPLGQTGGRSEFAIDFTLHFNGHESITTTDTLGLLTFNITFDNFVNENNQTVMNQPLTIKVYVIRRGQGARFYLDGINGSNLFDGRHPDQAALSLSTIFNRLGYLAGDEIYIVNQVTADKSLTWNGSAYDNVHIYRYNGGHDLATADGIVGNAENTAYTGVLVNVTHSMVMTGITLDGYYNDGITGTDDNKGPHTVTATAPMITVANGAVLELNDGVLLTQNNNNTSDGGAVNVASGGTLKMNADATITKNLTAGNGGGVYMDGVLNVSDNVKIFDNKKGSVQNNVYLTADRVVTIGTGSTTDTYGTLSADAKIGVTKTTTGEYTEVVHVDSESDVDWLNVPYTSNPNAVIYHDANIYQLERYNDITYLYWVGTWVTTVTWNPYFESRDADGYTNNMTAAQLKDIQTPQQLAWVISMVNGENGCTPQGNLSIEITADIDMDASIWVPIGTTAHPFAGTFEGNGHLIEGVHSTLVHNEMGVFGETSGTIQNAIFVVNFDANATNMGTVAGNMTGGTVSNVEAAGTLTGGSLTANMGGLVGVTSTGAEVHSSFAVNTMTSAASTVMGGLVGTNGGDLINSYANTAMSTATQIGGLVGNNTRRIENCYSVVDVNTYPSFAYNNSGTITYCYADKAGNYVSQGQTEPTLSGNYSPVKNRNEVGYMYGDNKVTASGNAYVKTTHTYLDKHTVLWDGLLSVLNQWVTANPTYTKWYRPISQDINGDLPVLAFSKAISMATVGDNKKFLDYSNDLDELLESYSGQTANIFLYDNATGVDHVPGANVNVFINEDAVLLQSGTDPFINTTVGVTFENSSKSAQDFWGNTLTYDWHLLSTPLSNAPLGITYTDYDDHNYWATSDGDTGQVDEVSGGYMPDGVQAVDTVSWDFYTYYEPQYHWINFKRNINSHHHYEEPHDPITYTGMEQTSERVQGNLIRGRGYMMAINQDSYLNTTGTLNNGEISIPLTKSGTEEEDATPQTSKDWGSNLVGNPYHAYLNLDAVTAHADNGGVNSFYIYDADNGTYGPYMTGSSINPAIPSKFIHPHQGFFVVTSEEVSGFKFTYDMATDTPNSTSYYRGEEQPAYPVVNLFVANENGNRDMAVVELDRPEIGGARKLNNLRNANFKISAHLEGQDYGLLFTPEGTQRIPVHFQTATDGDYTLTWSMYNGDFSNLFLVDNKTGVRTDMLRNDSYTFNATADDYASRFYLTYRVTGVDDYTISDGEEFAFFDGSEWIINGEGYLQVIDMTGRVLQAQQLSGNQSRVHINNVAAGVYVLQLNNGTKNMTQKIVIR